MMTRRRAALLLSLVLMAASCTPAASTPTDAPLRVVAVYFTPEATSWIPAAYDCAAQTDGILLSRTDSPSEAEVRFRLGEPPDLDSPAFQIDEATLALAVNAANPVSTISEAEVAAVFRGQIRNWSALGGADAEIHLWAYDEETDIQTAFDDAFLNGAPPFSMAKQAPNPEAMRSVVAEDEAALGILLLRQVNAELRAIPLNQNSSLPVLMIFNEEPQGAMRAFAACLQR